MSRIRYAEMTDDHHGDGVVAMMNALYAEDQASAPRDPARFARTLRLFRAEPARGRVILFLDDNDTLHGYALLIPLWSNEFGGTIAFVDELFVHPNSRRAGIARGFFDFIETERPFDAVAIALEVSPKNAGAWKLYESMGLEPRPFTTIVKTL